MELFNEYTDLVDLYDKAPTHPQTQNELKKNTMLKIPELINKPDFVFFDASYNDVKENKLPASLVAILPQKIAVINKETKQARKEVLVAYIEEPVNPNDDVTILATSFIYQ